MYALRHIYLTQSQQPFERLISSSLSFFSLHQRELYKTHECYWFDLDWCVHCLPITLTVKSFLVFCAGNSDRICGFLWWQGNKKSTFNSAALANDFHSLGVSVQFVCLGMLFIMKKTTVYKVLKTGNFENVNCVDTLLYSACLIFLRILRLGKPIPPSSLASKVLTEFLRRKYFYPLT